MLKAMLPWIVIAALTGCSNSTGKVTPPATKATLPVSIPSGATVAMYLGGTVSDQTKLEFKDPITGEPMPLPDQPILKNEDIASVFRSEKAVNSSDGKFIGYETILNVELTADGSAKLAAATAKADGRTLAIVINGELIAAPNIFSQMTQNKFTVNGGSKKFVAAVEAITGK
jgi:preprotein translocase subunit SecD